MIFGFSCFHTIVNVFRSKKKGVVTSHTPFFSLSLSPHTTTPMTAPGSAPAAPAVGAMPVVRALLLLDADGKRIAVKYYTAEW